MLTISANKFPRGTPCLADCMKAVCGLIPAKTECLEIRMNSVPVLPRWFYLRVCV